MTRTQQIEAELIRDPLQSASDIAKKFGVTRHAIYSSVLDSWDMNFGELRREVFAKHYQRVPETPNPKTKE